MTIYALCYFHSCTHQINHFFYCFIILLHWISSFSLIRYLFVQYVYVSIESIHCILLESFQPKAISLIASAKTLCLSLLNLCCIFDINLLFFLILYDLLWQYLCQFQIFQDGWFHFNLSCFLKVFIIFKFKFSFYGTLVCAFSLFIFTTVIY